MKTMTARIGVCLVMASAALGCTNPTTPSSGGGRGGGNGGDDAGSAAANTGSDGGAPATGSPAPADLVGKWFTDDGVAIEFEFDADGSYAFTMLYESSGDCIAFEKRAITESGSISAQGSSLTTNPASHSDSTVDCSGNVSTDDQIPAPTTYAYSVSGNTLSMTDPTNNTVTYAKE